MYHTNCVKFSENLVKLETRISDTEIYEGELLEIEALITIGNKNAPTPISLIAAIPGI